MGARGGTVEVLCIDDDESLLGLLTQMLERVADVSADRHGDPTTVLDRLTAGDYDCVVCDYDMPGTNGLDVLDAIRREHPRLPFILYTGKGSEEIASEAISSGVTDYLQKGSGTEHYELLANRIAEYAQRYRTGQEYALTEQRYRRLVEQSVVGIGLSQGGEFRYVNPKFAEIFGYSRAELEGSPVLSVIDERDHDRVRRAIEQRESGDVDSVHYVVTGKDSDGNRFDVEVNGSYVVHQGEPAVLGVVQPLDARRKALASLDDDAVAELRIRLESAANALETVDGGDGPVADARADVVGALDALCGDADQEADPQGRVDVAARCRAAWADAAPADASLTVAGGCTVVASGTALSRLFSGLWSVWSDADPAFEATLEAADGGFDVAVEPADPARNAPPDPPELGQAVELLGWEVRVAETDAGVRYAVRTGD